MKPFASLALLNVLCATAISSRGQGVFQNLDFENATVIFQSPGQIATSNALPGWWAFAKSFSGTNQLSQVSYLTSITSATLATNPICLVGATSALSGNFSVIVGGNVERGALSQTGLLPGDAKSLQFKLYSSGLLAPLRVHMNDQELPLTGVLFGSPYKVVSADISAFAGQAVTLTFTDGFGILDDIQFSPVAIPEPSATALLALSTLIVAARQFGRRRCVP